jgi:protein-S-isoprenylcysteine O-methyltransferase Ste14
MLIGFIALLLSWAAWLYPFVFRAPHNQKRPSITLAGPTRAGLFFECLAFVIGFAGRLPDGSDPGTLRIAACIILGILSAVLSWTAVKHLGRQFRVNAGLYQDHQLVRTGPYALVRHPIYTSLLAILGATLCLIAPWPWAVAAVLVFVVGTEIRVHAEDGLLASRFGEQFAEYRSNVPAYIPFIR